MKHRAKSRQYAVAALVFLWAACADSSSSLLDSSSILLFEESFSGSSLSSDWIVEFGTATVSDGSLTMASGAIMSASPLGRSDARFVAHGIIRSTGPYGWITARSSTPEYDGPGSVVCGVISDRLYMTERGSGDHEDGLVPLSMSDGNRFTLEFELRGTTATCSINGDVGSDSVAYTVSGPAAGDSHFGLYDSFSSSIEWESLRVEATSDP